MATAEQIPVEYLSDKVAEKNFAEMVGTTRRALQGKRQRLQTKMQQWINRS